MEEWCREIDILAGLACIQLHAAYATCTHGLFSKWSFLSRVVPGIDRHLQPLKDAIRTKLLPVLTGRPPFNESERQLTESFSGLGILNSTEESMLEFEASVNVTQPLTNAILEGDVSYSYDIMACQICKT